MKGRAEKKSGLDIASAPMNKLLDLLVLQNTSSTNITSPDFQIPANITTKCVSEELEIPLRCEVSFIDYEVRRLHVYRCFIDYGCLFLCLPSLESFGW